eukprot:287503_1
MAEWSIFYKNKRPTKKKRKKNAKQLQALREYNKSRKHIPSNQQTEIEQKSNEQKCDERKTLRRSNRIRIKNGEKPLKIYQVTVAETKEIKYKCDWCNKLFPHYNNLKMHLHVHLQNGKHECKFCKKRFPVKSKLTMHLRTHTGERPYSCRLCAQQFSRKDNCKTHEKKYCKNRNKVKVEK